MGNEAYPADATLNALGASENSIGASGIPHMWIGESPHYTNKLRRSDWLDGVLYATANAIRVWKDDSADLKFGVSPGLYCDGATLRSYAGASAQAVTDDAVNYVYLTAAGVLTVNTTAFPDLSVPHLALATIACGTQSASGVTGFRVADIVDYRGRWMFQIDVRALARHPMDLRRHPGDFTIVNGGWGTGGLHLEGDDARNNTITNTRPSDFALPVEYVADADVKVVVHARRDETGGGTAGTCTVDVECYKLGDDGTPSADLCATAAQALTTGFADLTFVITDTTLTPGDRIQVLVRTSIQENADAGTIKAAIGSVEVQCDRKG